MGENITDKVIILYHANWCGHCRNMMPEWEKFESAYNKSSNEILNTYKTRISIIKYEESSNAEKIQEANVQGFPTIKIESRGAINEYRGDRTAFAFFQKLIPEASPDKINEWLNRATSSNTHNLSGGHREDYSMEKIIFANSYHKYLKYKKKCESLNLI